MIPNASYSLSGIAENKALRCICIYAVNISILCYAFRSPGVPYSAQMALFCFGMQEWILWSQPRF